MPTLNMNGSYKLDSDTVNKTIIKISVCNYALGYTKDKTLGHRKQLGLQRVPPEHPE